MRTQQLGHLSIELPDEPGPAGRERYGHIDFERLPNTRDLGGMTTVDGYCIQSGKLLRSGALGFASAADIMRLQSSFDIRLVVDLRNIEELIEVPDPMDAFPQASFLHADILQGGIEGISQDAQTRTDEARRRAREAHDPVVFMEMLYPRLLLSSAGIEGYQAFLQAVLDCREGCALWHCYVGRDRCGMASMLLQAALGVTPDEMQADYLATNLYAPLELTAQGPASLRSFHAAVAAVRESYGSVTGYLTDALGITSTEREELRSRYLE